MTLRVKAGVPSLACLFSCIAVGQVPLSIPNGLPSWAFNIPDKVQPPTVPETGPVHVQGSNKVYDENRPSTCNYGWDTLGLHSNLAQEAQQRRRCCADGPHPKVPDEDEKDGHPADAVQFRNPRFHRRHLRTTIMEKCDNFATIFAACKVASEKQIL